MNGDFWTRVNQASQANFIPGARQPLADLAAWIHTTTGLPTFGPLTFQLAFAACVLIPWVSLKIHRRRKAERAAIWRSEACGLDPIETHRTETASRATVSAQG